MNNIFRKHLLKWSSLLMAVVILGACKRTFDEPPYNNGDPDLKITHTIKALQQIRTDNQDKDVVITDDIIFAGIVIADDKSGNFYKQIVLQDETAGINIQLDASNLNANFPIGRRVFVKAKGLTLGAYGGMMQLGLGMNGTSPARITQSLINDYLVAGSINNVVMPVELELKELAGPNKAYQNMLVKLKGVEVAQADLSKTFADPTQNASAVNINMKDCNGGTIILRTSSFANFAGTKVPQGKGDISGVYTFFNTTPQFVIRDTTDVAAMTGNRCDGASGSNPVTSISQLRALYHGEDLTVANASTITGVVVSNRLNESAGNYRLVQSDNGAGIIFRVSDNTAPVYEQGTILTMNISGSTLTSFQGEIQVTGVNAANITTATGGAVTPRIATIAQINANRSSWPSTLVTISNVTIAEGSSNSTGKNYTITDATGNLTTFVRTAAGVTLPVGTATSITGYVGLYKPNTSTDTTVQLGIRTLTDVVGAGGGGPQQPGDGIALTTSPLLINFDDMTASQAIPKGISVRTSSNASSLGTSTLTNTLTPSATGTIWTSTGGGVRNYASATGMDSTATGAEQAAATNRALGVRQVSGTDKDLAFVFEINNTTGKNNLAMKFKLQSLDSTSPRIATWKVDFATGDAPTSFTQATATGTMTTGAYFTNNTINVNFGSALNNVTDKVYIRIVTSAGTVGGGNRPTSAIDDVEFTWN